MMMTPAEQAPLISQEMVVRHVVVPKSDVVYVRGILEASDGIAAVYSVSGGDLTFAAMPSRAGELDEVLRDLKLELGQVMLLQNPRS